MEIKRKADNRFRITDPTPACKDFPAAVKKRYREVVEYSKDEVKRKENLKQYFYGELKCKQN